MVYNSSETQVTKDSDELYALPSSKKKCAGKNQLNHIRRLPPNELRDYSQSFLQYLDKSGIRVIIHYIDDKLTNKVDKIESRHDDDLESAKSKMSKKEFEKYAKKRWDEYLDEVHKVDKEYKEEKERRIKEAKEKEASNNRAERENALRVWGENTSRGANYLKAALATGGAIGAASLGTFYGLSKDNKFLTYGSAAVAGILAGYADTLINNQSAYDLYKKGKPVRI